MRIKAGALIADRYRLEEKVAAGGMGEVWLALDTTLGEPAALKILREEFTGEEAFLARLRIEAHNAQMLHHPNIAAIREYIEEDGTGILAMEYVPGISLAQELEEYQRLEPARIAEILRQAALGLGAAHRAGVIHRDVKPGNILLTPEGTVKLTDFGISTTASQTHLTATGKVMGTAQYLAPEQALGKPATARSDLYALGIVGYEALAGRRPFTGATHVDLAMAHVQQSVPPLRPSDMPELDALIMRMLSKSPDDRPFSGEEIANSLLGYLESAREDDLAFSPSVTHDAPASPEAGDKTTALRRMPDVHEPERRSGARRIVRTSASKPLRGTQVPRGLQPESGVGARRQEDPKTARRPKPLSGGKSSGPLRRRRRNRWQIVDAKRLTAVLLAFVLVVVVLVIAIKGLASDTSDAHLRNDSVTSGIKSPMISENNEIIGVGHPATSEHTDFRDVNEREGQVRG